MSLWTQKQQEELLVAISKYGTNWATIQKQLKIKRSRDSIIKRWHGKLKFQKKAQNKLRQLKLQSKKEKEIKIKSHKKQNRQKKQIEESNGQARMKRRNFVRQLNFFHEGKILRSRKVVKKIIKKNFNFNKKKNQDEQLIEKEEQEQKMKELNQEEVIKQTKKEQKITDDKEKSRIPLSQQTSDKIKSLILEGILNWKKISDNVGQTIVNIQRQWEQIIYPLIILKDKVGGSLKYSDEEDRILEKGFTQGMTPQDLQQFLPERTEYSIDARWRRLKTQPVAEIIEIQNKNTLTFRRQFLKRIVEKKHEMKQQLTSQQRQEMLKVYDKV